MTFEQEILEHCKRLIAWDREYAAAQIQWYFTTCWWLEEAIGPQLREAWKATKAPPASSPDSLHRSAS